MSAIRDEDSRVPPRPPGARASRVALLAGDRYSRRVALLKRLLPLIGLSLVALVLVWPRLSPLWDRVRLAAIDLRAARELKMVKPRYAGVDRQGRPYIVTAAAARQVPNRQDLMSLENPRADLRMHSGAGAVVTAVTGVYQSQAQLLDLFDHVTLIRDNGTRFETSRARYDLAHGTATGDAPIAGAGPSGDVSGQGFRVLDKGNVIVFTGRSQLLMKPARTASKPADPPGVPAAVAHNAAVVAAAAQPMLAVAAKKPAPARETRRGAHPVVRHHVVPHHVAPHHVVPHHVVPHHVVHTRYRAKPPARHFGHRKPEHRVSKRTLRARPAANTDR